jgi:hypothetical protein
LAGLLNPPKPRQEGAFRDHLALSQEKLGRTADAIAAYRCALELQPDAPDGDRTRAHLQELEAARTTPSTNPTESSAQPTQTAEKKAGGERG